MRGREKNKQFAQLTSGLCGNRDVTSFAIDDKVPIITVEIFSENAPRVPLIAAETSSNPASAITVNFATTAANATTST